MSKIKYINLYIVEFSALGSIQNKFPVDRRLPLTLVRKTGGYLWPKINKSKSKPEESVPPSYTSAFGTPSCFRYS